MLPFNFSILFTFELRLFPKCQKQAFPFYFGLCRNDPNFNALSKAIQNCFLEVIKFQKRLVSKPELSLEINILHQILDQYMKSTGFIWVRSQSMTGFHFTIREMQRQPDQQKSIGQRLEMPTVKINSTFQRIDNQPRLNTFHQTGLKRPASAMEPAFWPILTPNMKKMRLGLLKPEFPKSNF